MVGMGGDVLIYLLAYFFEKIIFLEVKEIRVHFSHIYALSFLFYQTLFYQILPSIAILYK